jgi:hypothetical protein
MVDGGGGLPAQHCPKAGGSGQRFRQTMKQGRKVAERWTPRHSSGARSNEFESDSKFKRFK